MSMEASLDWPQVSSDGSRVGTGHYWAVVTASPTSHSNPFNSLERESPLLLATSLPPLPRENCLGYPAAATDSGLPSPFPVHLDPGTNIPGAATNFAGILVTPGYCNLSGPDPEVAVVAFTNPETKPVRWAYDVVITVSDVRGGPGPEYCDAHNSSSTANFGSIVVPAHGVASVTLGWPHCSGNATPPPSGFYVVGVSATSSALASSAGQLVHLASR
jgi:hypothetical protein